MTRHKLFIAVTFLLLTVTSFSFFNSARADSYTFTGAVDGDWSNPANWAENSVPGPADTAYVQSASVTAASGGVPTVSTLIVEGSGVIATEVHVTGSMTVSGNSSIANTIVLEGGAIVTFNESSYLSGTIDGDANFRDDSYSDVAAMILGNANYYDDSRNNTNNSGHLPGTTNFYNSSRNSGSITGNATFYDTTINESIIGGNAHFGCDAVNSGTVLGTLTNEVCITNVTSSNPNASYGSGATILVDVTFTESVIVTGEPELQLELDGSSGTAVYYSGSGNNIITFAYTVVAGDYSADLDYANTSALSLNSGTIDATDDDTAATLTLPSPGASGSLGANKNIVVDARAPNISSVASSTTPTTGIVTWVTNEAATSKVAYGTTSGVYTTSSSSAAQVTSHSVAISGLSTNTQYYFVVVSSDALGNTSTSSEYRLLTGLDTVAPVITGIDADSEARTAVVQWTTNEAATSRVEYGLTSAYGSLTTEEDVSPRVTSHSVTLSGLETCTTYHFRVKGSDASSNESVSSDQTFETLGCSSGGGSGENRSEEVNNNNPEATETPEEKLREEFEALLNEYRGQGGNPADLMALNNMQNFDPFLVNLSLHDKKFDVFRLQKLLNHRGFILAQEGAGARGFETDYFGLRTYGALVRFQNSAGLPATGFFGPETRAYINSTR